MSRIRLGIYTHNLIYIKLGEHDKHPILRNMPNTITTKAATDIYDSIPDDNINRNDNS